jgi:8-oxo-dGTP pyrophosphatase MutT (NUDIX family)
MTEQAFEDIEAISQGATPSRKAVRPRHAATLILVKETAGEPCVLMGRRHGGHDFMPDKWVFPGGRVDRLDFTAPSATELRPEVESRLLKTGTSRLARALALAAVRETFEEAGLLLAKPTPMRPSLGPWRAFAERGALPDLAALDFVARAVTPANSPKRFDARFFLADAAALLSLDREPDCGELDQIEWFGLDDALSLDLPSVTRFVLRELPARLADPFRPTPSLRFMRGRQELVML